METFRILVVDDEADMRSGVARSLRDFKAHSDCLDSDIVFTVEQAESAEKAWEIVDTNPPQIVLLDHRLPGMSGIELLGKIKDKTLRDTLVIMITAYATIDIAVTATKNGAYDFLAKPFTPAELKNTVRKAAGHLMLRRHARKLDEEKRRVRFQFISVLAHELKSPLNTIEGYLRIIKDRSAGDDQAVYDKMLDRAIVRAEGMRKLIYDLLDLTRIESGNKRRELRYVDISELARSSVEDAMPDAQTRNITINLNAPEQLMFMADAGEISIIFNNLITNAVKYNKDGGRVDIDISQEEEGKGIVIRVADTGIGMTEQEREKLFGEFVRIKNAKTRDILGSGLGLSILKKLVTLYSGEIDLKSQPDIGSTFTVTLQNNQLAINR